MAHEKVVMFGDYAADAQDIASGFKSALDDWLSENPHVELVGASTSLAYDSEEHGVHGILTVVYREPEAPKED